uniref:Uncharacterized protein n=1 Tax=Cynoglossus semilaevis TaxID=244447 RepID=A0A3P8UUR6_CYNSE
PPLSPSCDCYKKYTTGLVLSRAQSAYYICQHLSKICLLSPYKKVGFLIHSQFQKIELSRILSTLVYLCLTKSFGGSGGLVVKEANLGPEGSKSLLMPGLF